MLGRGSLHRSTLIGLAAALALSTPLPARAQLVDVRFLYKLASSTGVLPFSGLAVSHDPVHQETIVVGGGRVHIFNQSGMEVFSFGEDPEVTGIVGAAQMEDGDFLLLAFRAAEPAILRANFRGELKQRIEPKGLPDSIAQSFAAQGIGYARGRIYLVDPGGMHLVVLTLDGSFVAHHDLARLCDVAEKRADHGVKGFRVAENGDFLFTVPTLFRAFVLSPEGALREFGQRGSAPGKFNVISGIAVDERGYYYVTDILKSAVLVFDRDFRWVKEFGYRSGKPGGLFSPVDVAAGGGKVFVSQFARKGVSVFQIETPQVP